MNLNKVVIFVRVSKGRQDFERQIEDLTAYSKAKGYEIVQIITEKISGATDNKDRKSMNELMILVQEQPVNRVLVSEVSRLGRKTSEVLQVLEFLTERGISVYVQNFNMDTLNDNGTRNPISQFLFTMLAEFARLERESLIQRINSGLEEARRKGKILGWKPGSVIPPEKLLQKYAPIVRQLNKGKSVRDIAAICEVGTATVQKVKKAWTLLNN
jgi:DNA invertase Pin-like site-specific DNA recombinase